MGGDFTSSGTVLVQLPAGHVKRPQLALMRPLEVFPLALPLEKFVLQGNVKAICKLGGLAPLHLLHSVPECGAVLVLGRGLGRQENVCADHTALMGVVTDLAVILAI